MNKILVALFLLCTAALLFADSTYIELNKRVSALEARGNQINSIKNKLSKIKTNQGLID